MKAMGRKGPGKLLCFWLESGLKGMGKALRRKRWRESEYLFEIMDNTE